MEVLQYIALFVGSLTILLFASDWFIEAAERVGAALGIPPFIIGLTIVAFGTSLPELATSIAAVLNGQSEVVLGNVVGSNIANIGLVLGLVAIFVKRIDLKYNLWHNDIPYLLGSSFLLYFVLQDQVVSILDAIVLLIALFMFLFYSFSDSDDKGEKSKVSVLDIVKLIGGAILVWLSADYTIVAISKLSELAGISSEVIAVTVVALGTSLPEAIVSLKAAKKGNTSLAVGNVVGSNIFNTFVVVAIPSFFGPIAVSDHILSVSLPFMIALTVIFSVATNNRKVTRWEGALLLLFYGYFFIQSFLDVVG